MGRSGLLAHVFSHWHGWAQVLLVRSFLSSVWLKSKNIPLEIKIIPVNRRQRVVFLYFELTCSQQNKCVFGCDFFQTSKAMLGKPGGGWPVVWWYQIGGSQIPV